jgi:PrtD family type I secretion system ABC transporter
MARHGGKRSELRAALRSCRGAFLGIALMSGVLNILALTGSFFMLQVYDRVIPSRSVPTLVGLCALMIVLYLFQGVLDALRMRILGWIGAALEEQLGRRFFDISSELALRTSTARDRPLAQQDLDQVRNYLSSIGATVLFDFPWMPLYFGICFIFHPLIGALAAAGAVFLCALMLLTEWSLITLSASAVKAAAERNLIAETAIRNAETARAMGFHGRLGDRWEHANGRLVVAQRRVANVAGGFASASKTARMILQSAILALGAWLVIKQEASAGIMIASSIMMSRALAPVELAIGSWKSFVGARQSLQRLSRLADGLPVPEQMLALPPPKRILAVEGLSVAAPGEQKLILVDVNFTLRAGSAVGVIGPSASGKSTLARSLVGVWPASRGAVRLDGASLDRWTPEALGRHVGYLPQAVVLLAGTVSENIARFSPTPDADAVVSAARVAGVHDMILRLPDGYETQIGDNGKMLSAGQRQRIALAVALYRDPFLVVLDEPNSNLDAAGESALAQAIESVRARRGIVVVIAHRPSVLAGVDFVLVLNQGRVRNFGAKQEMLEAAISNFPLAANEGKASK